MNRQQGPCRASYSCAQPMTRGRQNIAAKNPGATSVRSADQTGQSGKNVADGIRMANVSASALSALPLAMGYVPSQQFSDTYEPCAALLAGTIFPELNKPFCGKGGACRC